MKHVRFVERVQIHLRVQADRVCVRLVVSSADRLAILTQLWVLSQQEVIVEVDLGVLICACAKTCPSSTNLNWVS